MWSPSHHTYRKELTRRVFSLYEVNSNSQFEFIAVQTTQSALINSLKWWKRHFMAIRFCCHLSICSQSDWYYSMMLNYSLLGSAIYIISLSSVLPMKFPAQFPFLFILCHSFEMCKYLKTLGHDRNGFFSMNWAKKTASLAATFTSK